MYSITGIELKAINKPYWDKEKWNILLTCMQWSIVDAGVTRFSAQFNFPFPMTLGRTAFGMLHA